VCCELSEIGGVAPIGVVAQAESDTVVDRDAVELGGVDEADLGRFIADGDGAAHDPAEIGDVELLTDFAVAVSDDVARVGVDPE